jgi:biopolymer transport protein ExbD
MASIQVGGRASDKRPVDAEVPLIPFIDLLLCCIMFLLVTAVWNQLGELEANQQIEGAQADSLVAPPRHEELVLQLPADGAWVLASSYGDRFEIPRDQPEELARRLQQRRERVPGRAAITVAPEDGVPYDQIVGAMDTAIGAGFADVSLADGAAL